MIYDCFPFFNELDLLDIRLHELSSVVDLFVLVEATRTHTGHFKPLYYKMNKSRYKKFDGQILHIIVEDMPMTKDEIEASLSSKDREWIESDYQRGDNWVRERFQRNAIMRGLEDAKDDDIIIISDADEIVRASIVANLETEIVDGSNAVEQTLHTYYLNWRCWNMGWWGSKILRKKFISTPSEDRFHTPASKYIYGGGWHFGYMGGADAIRTKIKAYAHDEFNHPDILDNLEQRLYLKKDAIGRQYQYQVVPIDESYPKYIRDNLDKFKDWIYKEI